MTQKISDLYNKSPTSYNKTPYSIIIVNDQSNSVHEKVVYGYKASVIIVH